MAVRLGARRVSTAFVESTVNKVIAKRFAKKQQMQWTPRGVHLLMQLRTRVAKLGGNTSTVPSMPI
ncbi:hypothetical protein GCM10010869_30230 [Mesorhizobium tianshanense]|uniref:Uncharacterized protein n=1 Tax=Mesorhizobium tianshanense TaxID=39844 RepID=A0A562MV56_9HYPH|nr:hypothetical protein IQ26_06422 [Mesorhizobium tianshanense]GLS37430.1 hypothetical protein GCM10010869_30230 [Mesorhizobium tianshanense]